MANYKLTSVAVEAMRKKLEEMSKYLTEHQSDDIETMVQMWAVELEQFPAKLRDAWEKDKHRPCEDILDEIHDEIDFIVEDLDSYNLSNLYCSVTGFELTFDIDDAFDSPSDLIEYLHYNGSVDDCYYADAFVSDGWRGASPLSYEDIADALKDDVERYILDGDADIFKDYSSTLDELLDEYEESYKYYNEEGDDESGEEVVASEPTTAIDVVKVMEGVE